MATFNRFSDNPITWSFGVGRLFGIRIKIHILFVLFTVFFLLQSAGSELGWRWGFGVVIILFVTVFLHELGHCFGARYAGGEANEILMWPLGGLAFTRPPHTPGAHLVTTLAGPLVNFVICGAAATFLVVSHPAYALSDISWNPFAPFAADVPFTLRFWAGVVFYLSYLQFLFNVFVPMYPLDGGRIVQELLWYRLGYGRSVLIACTTGMVGAVLLGCVGFLVQNLLLLGIAVFGYVTCWHQRQTLRVEDGFMDGEFGYDFSQGYTSLERSTRERTRPQRPSLMQRWRMARAQRRREREVQQHLEEERMLDQLLDKVHREGLASLTAAERRFLDRVREKRR